MSLIHPVEYLSNTKCWFFELIGFLIAWCRHLHRCVTTISAVIAAFTFAEDSARKPRWNTRTQSRSTVLTRTLNQLQDRVWCRWNITWQQKRYQCFVYCILRPGPAMFKRVQQWWIGFSCVCLNTGLEVGSYCIEQKWLVSWREWLKVWSWHNIRSASLIFPHPLAKCSHGTGLVFLSITCCHEASCLLNYVSFWCHYINVFPAFRTFTTLPFPIP